VTRSSLDLGIGFAHLLRASERHEGPGCIGAVDAYGEGHFPAACSDTSKASPRAGEMERARLPFEKLLGYPIISDLYSEEGGPNREHLANFPQAFTHLALISAATHPDWALSAFALTKSARVIACFGCEVEDCVWESPMPNQILVVCVCGLHSTCSKAD
jgi:hypothetical protein